MIRGDAFWLDAFSELSTCRDFGQAIGPIPWTAMIDYGSRAGLGSGMMLVFTRVMRRLDGAYLEHHREESQRDAERAKQEARQKARQK